MKKYIIEIIGCDAISDMVISLNEEQKSLIEKLSTITYAIRKKERYTQSTGRVNVQSTYDPIRSNPRHM